MARQFDWVWIGLAALAIDSSSAGGATLYDGTSALTMVKHNTNIWSAQYPLPAVCSDSSWDVSITVQVTANSQEADLVFAIGTDTNYFAGVIAYDTFLWTDSATKEHGGAFVAPTAGQSMYSGNVANLYSATWRSTLVGSSQTDWEKLADRDTPISENRSPMVVDVVSDAATGITSVTITKNGASVRSSFSSVFAPEEVPSIFVDADSQKADESFLLSSISAIRAACPVTFPVTMVSSDDWELEYPLCETCADSSYDAEITVDVSKVSRQADLILALGTDAQYFGGVLAYDGEISCDFVTREQGAAWMLPVSGQPMCTAASGTANVYARDWRNSMVPPGSGAKFQRLAPNDADIGRNVAPLVISVKSSATKESTTVTLTKNGQSVTSTFSSKFGRSKRPSLFMACDSYHNEEFLVKSISVSCGSCGNAAANDAGAGAVIHDDEEEGINYEPRYMPPVGGAKEVAEYGGYGAYGAYNVSAVHVVAFLMGANLVCLVVNCLRKGKRSQRAYKKVSVDSGTDTESELVRLA